jgi:hypothetical protein
LKALPLLTANLIACSFSLFVAPLLLIANPESLLWMKRISDVQASQTISGPTLRSPECGSESLATDDPTAKKSTAKSSDSTKPQTTPLSGDIKSPEATKATPDRAPEEAETQQLSAEALRQLRVTQTLQVYFTRQVDVEVLRPWSIMHGLIAYGRNSQVVVRGEHVNAADYLCQNGIGNEMRIMYLENGRLKTRIGVGVQGHPGQLLAILAQSNIPLDYKMSVEGKEFTVKDLVEYEKRDCRSGTELTFKLIGLSHYCEPSDVWRNESGEKWSFPRLIREELAEPVSEGACGGTHRLMALSFAVFQVEKRNLPLAGEWLNAARKLDGYVDRAYALQNPDGSFSTEFFEKPGTENDRIRRCYSTGHIVEWLAFTLPANKMSDPRLTKAVDYLTELMLSTPNYDLDVGPRGHALHALAMYELKAYGKSSEHDHYLVTGAPLPPTIESKLVFDPPAAKPATVAKPASWTNDPPRLLQGRRRR